MKKTDEVVLAARLVTTFNSAQRRNKDFNLSLNYLNNIMAQTHCAYSGEKFSSRDDNEKMTLERWNNNVGYVEGNVIPVKKKYNNARGNFEKEELIQRMNEISGRIVRASDRGQEVAHETIPENEDPIFNVLPKYQEQYAAVRQNIRKREAHLKQKNISKEMVKSIKARIVGGYSELRRLEKASLGKTASKDASKKASEAENKVHNYDIIVQALTKLENMSRLDKAKLQKGLPMSASLFQLLRGKM